MMKEFRDPKRIDRIMNLINEIWQQHPTMRFFQLLDWLEHEYSKRNDGFGRREGYEIDEKSITQPFATIDLFYLEDQEFEAFLLKIKDENE